MNVDEHWRLKKEMCCDTTATGPNSNELKEGDCHHKQRHKNQRRMENGFCFPLKISSGPMVDKIFKPNVTFCCVNLIEASTV